MKNTVIIKGNKYGITIVLDKEKVEKWIKNGAKPTDTAKALIAKAGIDLKEV